MGGAHPGSIQARQIDEVTEEIVEAAKNLCDVLWREELPPNYVFQISAGSIDKWNTFIDCLERASSLLYKKPPKNENNFKRRCAISAYTLITKLLKDQLRQTD